MTLIRPSSIIVQMVPVRCITWSNGFKIQFRNEQCIEPFNIFGICNIITHQGFFCFAFSDSGTLAKNDWPRGHMITQDYNGKTKNLV